MKTYILACCFLSLQFNLAAAVKDSILPNYKSQFHLQNMRFEDCDACGCSANGGSMGFSSLASSNFLGLRYFYQRYTSKDGIFNNSPWVDENFNTVQIWARIPVTKRLQISALLPYHSHNRERTTGNETLSGLGDATVLAMYSVLPMPKDSAVFNHKLQLGGGVKAPTGEFDSENNKGSVNPGFQLGTGSWDYLLAAEYIITRKKLGFNAMFNYTIKTENKKRYQFGNQINYGSTLFYIATIGKVQLLPQLGIAGELFEANNQYSQEVPDSAGDIVFTKVGFEAGIKKWSVGLHAMLPINQNLSNGKVESNYRLSVNLNYSL
jgi:hypothetical protein